METNQANEWKSLSSKDIRPIRKKNVLLKRVIAKYTLLISITIILVLSILQLKIKHAIIVNMGDKQIAVVNSEEDFNKVFEQVEQEFISNNEKEVKLSNDFKFDKKYVNKQEISSKQEVITAINNNLVLLQKAYGIVVNGKTRVVLSSQDEANKTLDEIKNLYGKSEDNNFEFFEKVQIQEKFVEQNNIISYDEAFKVLTTRSDEITDYLVKTGDTLWDVADNNNISVEKLMELNPNKLSNIQPGQVIKLAIPKYAVNVKSVDKIEIEEKIPFKTEYKVDNNLYKGDKKVIENGKYGKKLLNLEIVSQNGVEIEKNILKENIISEPKTEVVAIGTKEYTNIFRTPAYGTITSRFGFRWGRVHEGIDISGNTGDPIYAADDGIVIFTGWKTGYGRLVQIDHQNGFVTYYAHNSANLVKVGQKVSKGTLIAKIGTTGNVTGPHVHFEVRENGKPIDPLKFLK